MTASLESALLNQVENQIKIHKQRLLATARDHACSSHPLFSYLETAELSVNQCAALLRNYDAHAGVLRRMLLHAAALMPERAVGFILENVRNEYGNGNQEHRHQLQLLSLATLVGVDQEVFDSVRIQPGVRSYIKSVVNYYKPTGKQHPKSLMRPAIAAGAITATEILALEEFRAMQKAFTKHGLADHIWFDHVNVEAEHTDESLALALFFIEVHNASEAVYFGLNAVLEANCSLYDGLLAAACSQE